MLEAEYAKFKKTVDDFDLLPAGRDRIIVAMSGGKDVGVLAHLLLQYRERERPGLRLEMITAPVPGWVYEPERFLARFDAGEERQLLERQIELNRASVQYWTARGYAHATAALPPGFDHDRLGDLSAPCRWCYRTKMDALLTHLANDPRADGALVCIAFTRWDAAYILHTQLLTTEGTHWNELREGNPALYALLRMSLSAFSPYPKSDMGIPGKTVTRIQPLIEFDDGETRSAARAIGFPIIPDICAELWGSGFDQERRYFSRYVERLTQTVPPPARASSVLHADYRRMIRAFERMGMLPPVEELDGAVYRFCDPVMRQPPPFQLTR